MKMWLFATNCKLMSRLIEVVYEMTLIKRNELLLSVMNIKLK